MDPEFFAAAAAGVASLLAVLGLRRRSSTPVLDADAAPRTTTPGAALASAGATASHNVSGAIASVGHQVLTLAAQGVGAAGAAVAKGAGLVVDGGVSLVDAVRPGKAPVALSPAPVAATETAPVAPATATSPRSTAKGAAPKS